MKKYLIIASLFVINISFSQNQKNEEKLNHTLETLSSLKNNYQYI